MSTNELHGRRALATGFAALALTWLLAATCFAHAPEMDKPLPTLSEYLSLGVTHILFGIDHVLFLVALIIAGGRTRDMVFTVSAFTLAHSVTLALGVFEVVTPNTTVVEVLIALSIAYVALENLLGRSAKNRFWVTLGFGLVHGLGFAGALAEIGVPQKQAIPALALFNLGVEAGQLLLVSALLPVVRFMHGLRSKAQLVRGLSVALIAVGLVWAGDRAIYGVEPPAAETHQHETGTAVAHARSDQAAPRPRSVYPQQTGALAPQVKAVCHAFTALPRERRAECSKLQPGVLFTSECERMLNASVRDGSIRINEQGANACIADLQASYAGCDWLDDKSRPTPASCEDALTGTRALGTSCRSSLECESGLHCQGTSPLDPGVCAAPATKPVRCGIGTDPLGAYLPAALRAHAECAGACARGRCQSR